MDKRLVSTQAFVVTVWIFGYGSLVWRPAMPYAERRPGYIHGWTRRFWQGSPDHRGVPGDPGRVVTLVREAEARCWGMAYRIEAHHFPEVLDELDYREKAGYERHREPVYFPDGSVEALVVGAPRAVAEMIALCHEGPPAAAVDEVIQQEVSPAPEIPPGFGQKPTR